MRNTMFVLSFAILAACGGGAGSGPLSASDAEDGCRRDCEHRIACDPDPTSQTVEACTTDCVGDVAGWVRADAFEAIIDCTTELACGVSDDNCLTECGPTDAHERYEARCREVFAACADQVEVDNLCETTPMPGVDADDVGFFCLITPSIVDQLTDCIPDGTTCNAGIACMQAVLETNGIDS